MGCCDCSLISCAFNLLLFGVFLYGVKLLIKYKRLKVDKSNEIAVSSKTVIVTGASAGIGIYTAEELASRGARVVMACRNIAKAEKVVQDIRSRTSKGELIIMELDLSSLASVRKFVTEFQSKFDKLDILINNAGVQNAPGERKLTQDGFEEQFGVNHLAHFLLTNLLLPQLKKAAPSRVVIVGSATHQWGKIDFEDISSGTRATSKDNKFVAKGYCNSKLANNLFNLELAKKLKDSGVNSYCLCPGVVDTELRRGRYTDTLEKCVMAVFKFFVAKTSQEGADTTIHCALSKYVSNHSGEMYQNCEFWDPSRRPKLSEKDAATLWEKSEAWVKLK